MTTLGMKYNTGFCKRGHELTEENTQSVGKAGFRCRICRREIVKLSLRRRMAVLKAAVDAGAPR